jgi:hypothetical protein
MKYTLLELTQSVLRSIKGEAVNSISDTQESLDVADIVKECYYTIISRMDLPEAKTLFELNASGDNTKPTLMTVPDDVYSVEWIEYDNQTLDDTEPNYMGITFVPLKDIFELTNYLDTTETYVAEMTLTINGDAIPFKYRSDKAPEYAATIDDNQIIFDSYDSEVDTTLQKSKSRAYGIRLTDWEVDDDFTPNLDAHQFQLLLKEAKAMAWQELKSVDNVAAQRSARQLMISAKGKRDRFNQKNMGYYHDWYPNYGRK